LTKLYHFNGLKIFLFCILVLFASSLYSQTKTVKKAINQKEKAEQQEEREYQKSREEALDAHYKRQSENTKEQMKQSKMISEAYRKQNEPGFFEKIVKKRKNKKQQRKRSRRQKR
jgi:cell division protein FtsL